MIGFNTNSNDALELLLFLLGHVCVSFYLLITMLLLLLKKNHRNKYFPVIKQRLPLLPACAGRCVARIVVWGR
jgi:hypothetical protein